MTPGEVVQAVGYACVAVLLIAATALVVGLVFMVLPGRDDGYRPIGEAAPPPPRRSPFAPDRDDAG